MKKIISVVALVLIAAVGSNAQVKVGPKVGLNFSTMQVTKNGQYFKTPDTQSLVGYHIGVIFQKDLKYNLFLEPGILFSTKGSEYDGYDDMKVVANYFEIPINLGYNIPFGKYSVQIKGGPYFAYGVGGTDGQDNELKWGYTESDQIKPFDMGINLGGGVQVNNFQVSFQYGFGLVNIAKKYSKLTSKNGVLGISVAYLF